MAIVKAYFLSDIHISSIEEPKTHWLLDFFRTIKSTNDMSHLYLMGDIFDLWVAGHKYFVDRFLAVIEELRRLKSLGVEIHYFEGNHDLYLDHFFGKVCGFQIHRSSANFNLGGLRVRAEHGDEMDPNDRGYIFLRWLLRTPVLEWLAPRLPEWIVVWLGERMSAASRHYTSEVKTISQEKTREVFRRHAEAVWNNGTAYDLLVSGHVHVIDDYKFTPQLEDSAMRGHGDTLRPSPGEVRVINLGSWFDGARALRVEIIHGGPARISWIELAPRRKN
jgi:UDP-2,3-diacylglucosamine hydrolase